MSNTGTTGRIPFWLIGTVVGMGPLSACTMLQTLNLSYCREVREPPQLLQGGERAGPPVSMRDAADPQHQWLAAG